MVLDNKGSPNLKSGKKLFGGQESRSKRHDSWASSSEHAIIPFLPNPKQGLGCRALGFIGFRALGFRVDLNLKSM